MILRRLLWLPLVALAAAPASSAPPAGNVLDYSDRGYVNLDPAGKDAPGLPASLRGKTGPGDERLILALFECLTRIDAKTGEAAPAAAERWTPAPDGRSWTFTLRADAVWSDGNPVKAQDFVRGWRRVLDPEPDDVSPFRWLFRPIQGAAVILDNDFGRRVLSSFEKELKAAAAKGKDGGVKGAALRDIVQKVGLKAVPGIPEQAVLRKMLRWGDDTFSGAQAKDVLEVVKSERQKRRAPTFDTYDAFGTKIGVLAKDDRTLVVETLGWVPYLPLLVARGPFAPIPDALTKVRAIGEEPDQFVSNGPYHLHKRGNKPLGDRPPPSTVHLVKSPTYKGPAPARLDEIRCWTDEEMPEELRRFKAGETQWVATLDPEGKKDIPAIPGYRTRPSGSVVFLRFRCDSPPFEKAEARRAFALAIDRAALTKKLWPAADPAERLVPPIVKGAFPGVRGVAMDLVAAKKALTATGWPPEKFPEVMLRYTDGMDDVAQTLLTGWEKALAVTPASYLDFGMEAQQVLRAGAFDLFLTEHRGAVNDAGAFLEIFESTSPDGGLGWRDAALDAFLVAARDVDAAAAAPEKLLGFAKNAATKAKLEALKASPTSAARDALREALLGEAEQRLLDEVVVYPLLFPKTHDLLGPALKGLGEKPAWDNCAFLGSLRDASR